MKTDDFVKVFDISESGFKDWSFSAFGLLFVLIGLVIFFLPRIVETTGVPNLNFQTKWRKFFRYYFLGFSLLWTATSFYSTYSRYLSHQGLIQENRCRIVEGPVENFVPMPYTGHAEESFSVAGIHFSYSDYLVTDGFNNTSSHGGPISKDSYVRICYDPSENQILRLEIRNFKGVLKDYSASENLFPTPEGRKQAGGNNLFSKLPWYSSLFIIFYFLDFLALFYFFAPYLNTFFRVKASPVHDCKIPLSIQRGKKAKLRNSILSWGNDSRSIWLRPRGFNLVQVQLMAGKLNLDDDCQFVTSTEVRFSSGFPLIMLLLLWTAFQFFSVVMPSGSQIVTPVQFVGIAFIFFAFLGFINLKILTSRMENIIQDAIVDIRGDHVL